MDLEKWRCQVAYDDHANEVGSRLLREERELAVLQEKREEWARAILMLLKGIRSSFPTKHSHYNALTNAISEGDRLFGKGYNFPVGGRMLGIIENTGKSEKKLFGHDRMHE